MRPFVKALLKAGAVLAALGLFVEFVSATLSAADSYQTDKAHAFALLGLALLAVALAGGLLYLFWRQADWVAGRITGEQTAQGITLAVSNLDLLGLLLAALGLFLLVTRIPDLLGLVAQHLYLSRTLPAYTPRALLTLELRPLVADVLGILAGVVLTFGSRRVVRRLVALTGFRARRGEEEKDGRG